ncbi:MAG: flagellar hook-length control protein FliK [Burkholderiaceae bacterium]|nr:flagellar hook-length control protein FliK [Rhodoferax sp.]MCP5285295.1 flagellar hook-length control protein FliK [Burkholderiaceae bacterium]
MPMATVTSLQGPSPAPTAGPTNANGSADGAGEGFADALQQARRQGGPAAHRPAERHPADARQKTGGTNGKDVKDGKGPDAATNEARSTEAARARQTSADADDDVTQVSEVGADSGNATAAAVDNTWLPPDLAAAQARFEGTRALGKRTDDIDLSRGDADTDEERSAFGGALSSTQMLADRHRATRAAADAAGAADLDAEQPPGLTATDRGEAAMGAIALAMPAGEQFAQSLRAATTDNPTPAAPLDALSALTSSPGHPTATGADTNPAVVAEQEIRPSVHSPGFAPALGAQLTLLVKEGVTEARLHLNPLEMGPINVQIQLEGTQARVEMVAEHSATRQALEQSMPSLASALRDSGLTLAGGGVFEQSTRRDQAGEPGTGSPRAAGTPGRQADDDTGATAGAAMRSTRARGVVDLYA